MRSVVFPNLQSNHLFGFAWAVVIALLFLLALDTFVGNHHEDSSTYLYVGKGILEGEIPYLDRWDNKGPLQYLLNAVGLVLNEEWGFWVMQGLFLLASSAFAFLVFRRSFGSIPALFALALFLVFYRWFASPGNFTEQYGLLFQFLALYLFLRSQEERVPAHSHTRFALIHIGIGVLGAAAFLIRPNLVALWLVIGIFWFLRRGNVIRKLAWAVCGGGSALAAVAVFFIAIGAWDALWSAVFTYNFAYSTATSSERAGVAFLLATETIPISLLVVAAWAIALVFFVQHRTLPNRSKGLLPVALMLLPLEVVSLSLSGFTYHHYFLTVLPVATLLLAFLVWWFLERLHRYRSHAAILLLLVATFYLYSEFQYNQLIEKYVTKGVLAEDSDSRLAARIKEWTDPSDYVLVWGYGPRIHLLSERDAPSRYFYHFPLIQPHYTSQAMRKEFLTDLEENMPVLIVDADYRWFPSLARSEHENWRPNRRHKHDLEDFEPLFNFIEANYVAIGKFLHYAIYALKSDSGAPPTSVQGELIIRSNYDVYLKNQTLIYVRHPCAHDDARNAFILHVIPVDKSVIDGDAHANLDFYFFEGVNWQVGESCVVSVELPDFPIASIRTGQYNAARTAHEWLSEYHFSRPN